jgi:N-acetylglutamate synthase-like GNAT family acetyltransferase
MCAMQEGAKDIGTILTIAIKDVCHIQNNLKQLVVLMKMRSNDLTLRNLYCLI